MKNKIALITGASRGLGRSVAKSLAKKGVELILVARTISALEELDDEIKSLGSKSTIVPMDLEDNDSIDVLGGEIHKKWGKLDILVSSAATVGEITPVSHLDPKIWNKVINLNLSVNFRLIRSFEPLLKNSNQSYAIFLSDNNSKIFSFVETLLPPTIANIGNSGFESTLLRASNSLANNFPIHTSLQYSATP